jgi:uncharacterized membrane protein YagU involved in acid resistance
VEENGIKKIQREIVILPTNDSLSDLGLRNPEITTQIKVKDKTSENFWWSILPTIILFMMVFAIAMVILSKM